MEAVKVNVVALRDNITSLDIVSDYNFSVKVNLVKGVPITLFNKYHSELNVHIDADAEEEDYKIMVESNDYAFIPTGVKVDITSGYGLRIAATTHSHLKAMGISFTDNDELLVHVHNQSDKPIAIEQGSIICMFEVYRKIKIKFNEDYT